LVLEQSLDLWNEIRTFPKEMIYERVLESRSFEDKEINELVKKLQLNLCLLFIDRA
ncbi:30560_t:CDS:1, partial [Racocetra persica]